VIFPWAKKRSSRRGPWGRSKPPLTPLYDVGVAGFTGLLLKSEPCLNEARVVIRSRAGDGDGGLVAKGVVGGGLVTGVPVLRADQALDTERSCNGLAALLGMFEFS